jgi:hypothetical protein
MEWNEGFVTKELDLSVSLLSITYKLFDQSKPFNVSKP